MIRSRITFGRLSAMGKPEVVTHGYRPLSVDDITRRAKLRDEAASAIKEAPVSEIRRQYPLMRDIDARPLDEIDYTETIHNLLHRPKTER
jgi:hypothetical protein